MKILYVNFLSGFTNNIFQYIYALLLHEKVKEKYKLIFSNKCFLKSGNKHNNPSKECNIEITPLYEFIKHYEFKYISEYYGKFKSEEKNELLKNANINPDINNLNIDYDKDIVLSGYFQNFKYYQNKKEIIKLYLNKLLSVKLEFDFKDDDIVVHIRGDDLKHIQYSINYYTKYLNSYKNIYIITDNPNDNYVNYILKTYKNSNLITKKYSCYGSMTHLTTKNFNNYEIIRDFLCLYNAKNIIMSISTFSWMGAWLSNSNKIYFPINNDYFKNLIVNDKKYIYV
tara:strand:- start:7362 stop:8213 length:852 start_codon:yes stop_codon:yes gene_type:complete